MRTFDFLLVLGVLITIVSCDCPHIGPTSTDSSEISKNRGYFVADCKYTFEPFDSATSINIKEIYSEYTQMGPCRDGSYYTLKDRQIVIIIQEDSIKPILVNTWMRSMNPYRFIKFIDSTRTFNTIYKTLVVRLKDNIDDTLCFSQRSRKFDKNQKLYEDEIPLGILSFYESMNQDTINLRKDSILEIPKGDVSSAHSYLLHGSFIYP